MSRLGVSVTQGGADAFAIAAIVTGLNGQVQRGYSIDQILFNMPIPLAAANSEVEICLSRRIKTAMPLVTDVDVIWKRKIGKNFATSGAWGFMVTDSFVPTPDSMIVVEDPLYLVVDSALTAVANTFTLAFDYHVVTISEVDRLTLLTQSLVSA
jgi:hypothetical protein